jgi:uncharacterized membrane protein
MDQNNFSKFNNELLNKKLPNATAVLILGIASILTCCCYGILSVILGTVGLFLAKKDTQLYKENPSSYSNYNNLKTGKILCIIGIVLGAIFLIYVISIIAYIGIDALKNPELLQERIREISKP